MREVKYQKVGAVDKALKIEVADEPGLGGASFKYDLLTRNFNEWAKKARIEFQKGPVVTEAAPEGGPNGVSDEALVAVVIDRLRSFQAGPASCRENAIALTHLEDALHWLNHRTADRIERGVEGKVEK